MKQKPIIHGFASPFKYATVDKPGFVSGFFRQENNWKNYPICSDCALLFEMGKNYITANLARNFYGKFYYLVPKPILDTSPTFLKQILQTLEELEYKESEKSISTREDYIMHKIGKELGDSNSFSLNLMFYEENPTTKAIKIKLLLEEIVPSRFREIFITAPEKVNYNPLYEDSIYLKKGEPPTELRFSFGLLRDFFEDDFYSVTQAVFLGLPLDKEVLYAAFIKRYREHRNKEREGKGYFEFGTLTIKKAHLLLAYLGTLNIINCAQNNRNMEVLDQNSPPSEEISKEYKRKFDINKYLSFVSDNQGFLDSEFKEGIFAVGVLTKLLFNLQSANLDGGTPFEKKLKGYRLNPETLKNIYVEALEKISQYTSSRSYTDFREILSQKFVRNAHHLGKISNNELSFYFVAGLEFGNQFKSQEEK
jgi:CRISPR-associated protein Csh1